MTTAVPEYIKSRLLLSGHAPVPTPPNFGRYRVVVRKRAPVPGEWHKKRTRGLTAFLLVDVEHLEQGCNDNTQVFLPLEPGKSLYVGVPVNSSVGASVADFVNRPLQPELVEAIRFYASYVTDTAALAPETLSLLSTADRSDANMPNALKFVGNVSEDDIVPAELTQTILDSVEWVDAAADDARRPKHRKMAQAGRLKRL